MALNVGRILTSYDEEGRVIIGDDKVMTNVSQLRSGNHQRLIWATDDAPAEIDGDDDPAERNMDIELPARGSVFQVLELVPGKDAYMHRTDTIDYAICMSGECVMVADDGDEINMKAGDIMVQRGTWQGWANRSDKSCQIAFILIGAKEPKHHLHPLD